MSAAAIFAIDVGRRVIQCPCGFARTWHGPETAKLQGWHASYRDTGKALVRVWVCAECYVPPLAPCVPAEPQHHFAVPNVVHDVPQAQLMGRAWAYEVRGLKGLIARLFEIDRPRGEAFLREVLRVLGRSQKRCAKEWRAFGVRLGAKKLVAKWVGRAALKKLVEEADAAVLARVQREKPPQPSAQQLGFAV